jgi:cyclohexanecarboxylate-CoA ligase
MAEEYRRRGWWRDDTFLDDLRRHARERPRRTAVITRRADAESSGAATVRCLDYAELSRLTDRCAGALAELGLRPGDTFAVQLSNRWELAVLSLACIRAGVLLCPLMPVYRRRELEVILRVTRARALVTMAHHDGTALAEIGAKLAAELPDLREVLVADATGPADGVTRRFEQFFFGTAWEERYAGDLDHRELGPDDPYLVLFTSGTTSEPKGALHSQNTLYAAIRGEAGVFGLDESLVMSTLASYTHYTGVVQGMLMPLVLGGTMVFQDTVDPPAVLDLLARYGVTFLYCAPPFLRTLLDEQRTRPRDLPALRWLVSGSAPIPPPFVDEARTLFGLRLFSLWGMTENGPVTISRPEDPEDWAARSDGSPIADMELRVDLVGQTVDGTPGNGSGIGVLWVRGPTQCLGYYRREELYTAELDADGWFNTGDLARDDGRGGIRITGRAKDMILRRANIAPVTDLETLIGQHPTVREAAVVGLPDGRADETICAVVSPEPGRHPTLDELRAALADAGMAELYWPERLEVVDALPRTATGKVRKVELKERYA